MATRGTTEVPKRPPSVPPATPPVIEVTGSNSEIVYEALPMDDPKVRQPDITRARGLLGWEPKMSLHDGLRRTIEQAGVDMLVGAPR